MAVIALGILSSGSAVSAAVHGPPGKANPRTTVIIDYVSPKFGGPQHPGPHGSGGGGETPHDNHFQLIGGVWADDDTSTTAVDPNLAFEIDLRGFPAGSEQAILDGFAAWEAETDGELLASTTINNNLDLDFGDDVNSYSMRNLGGRVLAVTVIKFNDVNSSGTLDSGDVFLAMDVVFNFTQNWATDETSADTRGKWFHVRDLATHENGHVFGLDDLGDGDDIHTLDADEEQTMWRSAAPKEDKKRSLEMDGDIPGIRDSFLGYVTP